MFELYEPSDEVPTDFNTEGLYDQLCDNKYDELGNEMESECGGRVVAVGGNHHYNGSYNCYTLTLECENCGVYDVECV